MNDDVSGLRHCASGNDPEILRFAQQRPAFAFVHCMFDRAERAFGEKAFISIV